MDGEKPLERDLVSGALEEAQVVNHLSRALGRHGRVGFDESPHHLIPREAAVAILVEGREPLTRILLKAPLRCERRWHGGHPAHDVRTRPGVGRQSDAHLLALVRELELLPCSCACRHENLHHVAHDALPRRFPWGRRW